MADESTTVELYIYDLTNGFASILAPAILGRAVEGVWHTAVVAYEREYFFGGSGVTSCAPGGTQLGAPHRVDRLGETFVPFSVFVDYIQGLSTTSFTAAAYNLLSHNCNHFSDELAQFLCGARVPKHILAQPDELLGPGQRAALQALLDNLLPPDQATFGARAARRDSPDYTTLNSQIEEARAAGAALQAQRSSLADKLARKEKRKEKKRRKRGLPDADSADMAEAVTAAELPAAGPSAPLPADADEREAERKRARHPPILYPDIDGAAEFERLSAALEKVELSDAEKQSLDELQQYLVHNEGSWVLGDDFLAFIGRVLTDGAVGGAGRAGALRCLAAAALREDVSLLLHQDRRHHALLSYAHLIDAHPLEEQRALALFMCNLFENISSSEWLLYISEWEARGAPLSNIRATTKVCVHALLAEDAELRELGTALVHNVATREVFDEVCVELGMAVLQLLQYAPGEEHLHRALTALARLAQHSPDVPQLVALVGPDPSAFRGTSQRVDEQIDILMKTVK